MNANLNRLHGLDFCRAVLMVLGLFYHVGLIYGIDQDWRVLSNETSWFIKYISDFIQIFRMEAFYLISGFFYMLIFSKGRNGFAKDRVLRALLPLLFCGLLLNPIMNYYSYNKSYDWDSIDYLLKGQWLGHLWFLGNLVVYFIISLPLCKFILSSKEMSPVFLLFMIYLGIPSVAITGLAVAKLTFDGTVLFITFHNLFYYYSYFIIGCFCFINKALFSSFLSVKYFLLSFLIFIAFFLMSYFNIFAGEIINKVLDRLSSGSLMLSILSILYVVGSRRSKVIRNFSDSSYTVYILHQPLIILLYVFVFERLTFEPIQEYILMIIGVFFISYLFHNIFVKNSQILKLLFNGVLYSKRKSN
jgi:glucan biosynthesis protein C